MGSYPPEADVGSNLPDCPQNSAYFGGRFILLVRKLDGFWTGRQVLPPPHYKAQLLKMQLGLFYFKGLSEMKKSFTVYVLYSEKYDNIYIGYTSNLTERFKSHN